MVFLGHHQLVLSVTCFLLLISKSLHLVGAQGIGVTLAREGNVPWPKDIVKQVVAKQVRRVRIYDGYKDRDLVAAFRYRGVQVMVGVGNQDVIRIARGRLNVALDWLRNNIQPHADAIFFRCILVGGNNMVQSGIRFMFYAYQALVHLQKAMWILRLHIPFAVEVDQRILSVSFPPSAAEFDPGALKILRPILECLHKNNDMLVVDIYPMIRYVTDIEYKDFPLSYALCRGGSDDWSFDDGGRKYYSMVDGQVDAFYTALEKLGIPWMVVMVGETGWPFRQGISLAKSEYAADYVNHMAARLRRNTPTPLRSWPVETYLHTMYVQDRLHGEKEWYGLYYPNGTATYSHTI